MQKLFLLVIILMLGNICLSQNDNFFVGINVGSNIVNYGYNKNNSNILPIINLKQSFGYTTGLIVKYYIKEKFGFSSGIRKISKGYKNVINNKGISISPTIHCGNFEFSIEVSYFYRLSNKAKLETTLGFTYDLMRQYPYMESSGWFYNEKIEQINNYNYSIFFKTAIIKTIKKNKQITLNLSYHKEFVNVLHTHIDLFDEYGNKIQTKDYFFKGNYFSLELGYFFPLRKKNFN